MYMQLIDNIIRNAVNLANALVDDGIATVSTPRRSSRIRRTQRMQRTPYYRDLYTSDSDDENASMVNNARSTPPLIQFMDFARRSDLLHERESSRGPSPNMTPNLLEMSQNPRERADDSGDETEEFNYESFVRDRNRDRIEREIEEERLRVSNRGVDEQNSDTIDVQRGEVDDQAGSEARNGAEEGVEEAGEDEAGEEGAGQEEAGDEEEESNDNNESTDYDLDDYYNIGSRPICVVCKEDLLSKEPRALLCQHVVCSECINKLIKLKPERRVCPVCRKQIRPHAHSKPLFFG